LKIGKIWTKVSAWFTGNRRLARWTNSPSRSWRPIPAAPVIACVFLVVAVAQNQSEKTKARSTREAPPYWAYAVEPSQSASDTRAEPADDAPRHVPGSTAALTFTQIGDLFNVPDWHPAGHPAMPEVVARGRKPDVMACGYCHLPNGQGRPENASLAGLPAGYIVQQMADFKSGARQSSDPRQLPIAMMIALASKANEKEIQAAAEYFSELKPKPWIRVVETRTVPRTHVAGWMLVVTDKGGTEPIGQRIIETPENLERTELRDDASGFIAYVPVGSTRRGKTLVTTGGEGKTVACTVCHGPNLKGSGDVPPLAGRSPSYIVRQLYDMQSGARAGLAAQVMQAPVAKLTVDDMVSIAAYTASLHP
jgi:cytochrome c553